ncbi:MAG: hypothetical protein LC795_11130 [Acidobacteria bacterium]|nr:hypothetical protein [Acidobacteriota bacterium]MCA1619843.1 hypothetical protein [Acidobacteriota bacterium]
MAERRLILEAGAAGSGVDGRLTRKGRAENAPRPFNFSRSGPYFAGLFLLALVAYWPTYFSRVLSADHYTHFHASLAAVWILMLAAQPMLIRAKRLSWHRLLGGFSYVLAPLIVVSIVLLAHSRIKGLSGEAYAVQTYILYLQVSLTVLFGLSYALAIYKRHALALHARFMVCTAFTLIDPVVIRLMFWMGSRTPSWNYQWVTFGLTDLVIVALIFMERRSRTGRRVFPVMLAVFVLAQIPALFGLTNTEPWQAFARWFAALPLT